MAVFRAARGPDCPEFRHLYAARPKSAPRERPGMQSLSQKNFSCDPHEQATDNRRRPAFRPGGTPDQEAERIRSLRRKSIKEEQNPADEFSSVVNGTRSSSRSKKPERNEVVLGCWCGYAGMVMLLQVRSRFADTESQISVAGGASCLGQAVSRMSCQK